MASVNTMGNPSSEVDYSLTDGRVRSFTLEGKVLYDEDKKIAVYGWLHELVKFVKELGLDVDNGRGLHAFVIRLINDGLIKA